MSKKKVLFLITKSKWGEKWIRTHFARLAQLVCEELKQTSEQVDSVCNIRFFLRSFKNEQKLVHFVHSLESKTALSRPIT